MMHGMNKILLIGVLLGVSSLMLAAYVDHGLSYSLSEKSLRILQTALRYHQLYAVVITIIGLIYPLQLNPRAIQWLMRSATCFILGIFCFSFSIYFATVAGFSGLLSITPIGGLTLMAGWVTLFPMAFIHR